ncbi:conserved hypothetical protein [gamma proteobacterium NOR5-3]|nr:conserved hypothetical protein [gamma proteobacterium NOR5-3]
MKILCEVFRSPRKAGMYLYVKRDEGLVRVPESLLSVFGDPESALVIALDPQRKLAMADAQTVLGELEENGFYVQMPPASFSESLLSTLKIED